MDRGGEIYIHLKSFYFSPKNKKSHFSLMKKCDYLAEKVGFEPT